MQGKLLITAALARLAFILYGEWQDRTSSLKYTDVDYAVFTDAARFVYQGESPYQRATYRYTPLLAMLLVPSIPSWSFPQFGKLVFVICDLISGWLILQLLQDGGGKEDANKKSRRMALSSFIWLLNPFIITISTRGSSESLLIVLVLSSIYLLRIKRIVLGSIVFGIAVHLKIYPIIYGVPLLLMIDSNAHLRQQQQYNLLSRNRLVFFLVSACTFLGLGIAMYEMYGQEFLNETYLYHIIRKDHRHNYSIFFYYIYLSFDQASSNLVKLLAFIPQFGLVGLMGVLLPRINIFLCLFCQTFVFVIFNKVCTAQV